MFDKKFWKAYLWTTLQVVLVLIISVIAFLLLTLSMSSFYPLINSIQEMEQTGAITSQLTQELPLFGIFIKKILAILLSYVIILSGILSFFDMIIVSMYEKTIFSLKSWLYEWFRYSCASLLLLIVVYLILQLPSKTILYDILSLALILLSIIIFCYAIILMQFKLSIRKTFINSILLLLLFIIMIFLSLIILWLLNWPGIFIILLVSTFLLLWSKLYLRS